MDKKIYTVYHSRVKLQKRIIDKKNFTYRNIVKLIDKYCGKKSKILDIGCGVGTIDFYLSNNVKSITGIDISKKAIEVARRNAEEFKLNNIKFVTGNVDSLKFNSKFNTIICSEIIEHVDNDDKLLVDINKLLYRKGTLILTTPLDTAFLYKIGLAKNFDQRVGHLRRYNVIALKKKLKESNFRISKIIYQDGPFRNTFFIFKSFDPIIRIANRFSFISDLFTIIDNLSTRFFEPADICIVAKKI